MRPLPTMQRSRAALASIAGHCLLGALLTAVGTRTALPPAESPLIMAELVTMLDPGALSAPQPNDVPADEPLPADEGPPDEPSPEPAKSAPAPAAPEIAAPAPEPTPPSSTEAAPSPVRTVQQASDPAPVEQLALDPPVEVAPAAEERAADGAPTATDTVPRRAFASHEEQAVRRELSSWTGRFNADEPDETLTWREDGQHYTAVLKKVAASDVMGMEQLAVELTTERGGERLVTELRMTRLAFSNFGQFVNRWDPEVGLHQDFIGGRFHSNSAFSVHREGRIMPVFGGKVTVADDTILTEGPGFINRRKLFPAGIEMRVRRIALPEDSSDATEAADREHSERLDRDSSLTFHADGTASWRPLEDGSAERLRALGEEPFYFVAADDVTLHVRGTVNGKVLVYSPGRIVISDDLRYATDPRTPHGDDYLGLVADGTVEIAEPEHTGPGDLEIYASIYARQRFVVRNFRSRASGTLRLHGSLTAGTLSATEPRYATRIEFDDRLTTMRAPGFPLSDRYELDETSGEWRVVGKAD